MKFKTSIQKSEFTILDDDNNVIAHTSTENVKSTLDFDQFMLSIFTLAQKIIPKIMEMDSKFGDKVSQIMDTPSEN